MAGLPKFDVPSIGELALQGLGLAPKVVTQPGSAPGEPAGVLVRFASDDPYLRLDVELAGPAIPLPPKPKIDTVARPGAIGLTQWVGQDPYEFTIPVRIDGYPSRSVEREIAALESLAEVAEGRDEPPIVRLAGAIVQAHPNLTWRITGFSDPLEDPLYVPGGRQRCRWTTTVSLIQRVTDRVLSESLAPSRSASGITTRTWRVRSDENDLYDVARHAYGDPMRASDIARANQLRLGAQLHTDQALRLP